MSYKTYFLHCHFKTYFLHCPTKHTCYIVLQNILVTLSYKTYFLHCPTKHTCFIILQIQNILFTLFYRSCLLNYPTKHTCYIFLQNILVMLSYKTYLLHYPKEHTCYIILQNTLSYKTCLLILLINVNFNLIQNCALGFKLRNIKNLYIINFLEEKTFLNMLYKRMSSILATKLPTNLWVL